MEITSESVVNILCMIKPRYFFLNQAFECSKIDGFARLHSTVVISLLATILTADSCWKASNGSGGCRLVQRCETNRSCCEASRLCSASEIHEDAIDIYYYFWPND